MTLYTPNKTKLYFGNGSTLIDLTPHMEDGWTVTGNVNIARRRRATGTAPTGISAYSIQTGLAVTGTVRGHADTRPLLAGMDGIVWIEDTNPSTARVVAFPAEVKARPISSPSAEIVTYALALTQSAAGAVEAARSTSGSHRASAGTVGYQRTGTSNIKPLTGSQVTATSANPVVSGSEWKAQG